MSNNKNNSRWSAKQIICAVLALVSIVACVGGVAAFAKNNSKTILPTSFEIGDLDSSGKYVKNEQSLYTREAFDCIGLRIEPDFEFNGTYDVYYYDYNDNFVGSKLENSDIYDEDYPLAKMARVVIRPEIPEDIDEDEFKIHFYDKLEYASKLKITVDKKQNYLYDGCLNLYNDSKSIVGKKFYVSDDPLEWNTNNLVDSPGVKVSEKIAISDEYEKIDIFIRPLSNGNNCYVNVMFANEEGNIAKNDKSCRPWVVIPATDSEIWTKLTVEIPKDVDIDHMIISFTTLNADCYIYGYND